MLVARSLIALVICVILGWVAVDAARRGSYRTRSGVRVDRRKQPVFFWVGVAVCGIGSCFFLAAAWRFAVGS
jgi:hypothetical protein